MTEQQPTLDLWQVLAPIIDEQILQALRDMDDPDAERDQHGLDAIEDYCLTMEDLADWLVPEEPPPDVPPYWAETWAMYEQRLRIRYRLLAEARRAREG